MNYCRILSVINGLFFSCNVAAATVLTPLFSPYVDITLNTHWDSQTQIVIAAKDAGLNFNVNIMAMDYGPAYSGDMGAYAIQAATNLHQFLQEIYSSKMPQALWKLVEVTPMIGVNDVNSEQFTLKNADQLRQFAQKNQLGGLSMWSVTRDKPCADQWANPICSGNNLQTQDYEFLTHFQ